MKKWVGILLVFVIGFLLMKKTDSSVKNLGNSGTDIIAFGDSLTAGYGAPKGASYPAVLSEKLGRPVINLGLSGETAVHAPQRLAEVFSYNPYMVLIEFGANDHMQGLSREEAVLAVSQIVEAVQQAGAVAVIIDTGGPGMGEYSRAYRKLAKEKKAIFVPAILKGIFHKRQYKSDMVHPNAAGYKIVAEHIFKEISPYL